MYLKGTGILHRLIESNDRLFKQSVADCLPPTLCSLQERNWQAWINIISCGGQSCSCKTFLTLSGKVKTFCSCMTVSSAT